MRIVVDVPVAAVRLAILVSCPLAFAACGNDHGHSGATQTPTSSSTPTLTPTTTPTPTEPLLRLPALHAEPDPIDGGRIIDAEGREVLLRGANVNALVDYWQPTAFATTFALTEGDADMMAAIGWSAVRLLLSWSRVEPEPGIYDEAYLDDAAAAVRLLASRGMYSIIDLHQDAWGATLAARPDEACLANEEPAFGWDGAPAWATLDGGARRCTRAGVRETSPAVLAAFQAFWDDAPGPDWVGIRTRYAGMLGHIAARFAGEPAVAGYDIMNEPNAFSAAQLAALAALYGDALREIRAAEGAAGEPAHLVFFEPGALWSTVGRGPPPEFARDRDVVYAPHVYTGGFSNGPITAAAFQIARDEAAGFGGAPVVSGEWGTDPRRANDPDDGYFITHQQLEDQFRIGATLWTWHESCGDPHKAADYRAGTPPYVWGEFDLDCTTNEVVGIRTALVRQLTRAYVRAAPGTLVETSYDDATGRFSARGSAAAAGAELVAFYPAARHGTPVVGATGLSALRALPAPGGNFYIVARSDGGAWALGIE